MNVAPQPPRPTAPPNDPIFILGITERSGTNFLFHLLGLHPDCHYGGPIWENYLTLHLDTLVGFADAVYARWNPDWKVAETIGPSGVLLEDLGNGLIHYLNRQLPADSATTVPSGGAPARRRLVTKTPSVRNLSNFFRLFPRARLLIIIRDGRAVVESSVRSFHMSYERAMWYWTKAGENILQFLEQPLAQQSSLLVVKYEELFHHTESQLRKIFEFLQLSSDVYDFAAAQRLPVVGSSELTGKGEGAVHWDGVAKKPGFDPTRRGENWSSALQDRFLWIGGEVSRKLGYPTQAPSTSAWRWTLRNRALDLTWPLRRRLSRRA